MPKNLKIPMTIAVALALTALAACSGDGASTNPVNNAPPPAPPRSNDSNTPALVYPQGWTGLTLMADSAKMQLDSTGHYNTDRNACGQDAAGSLDMTAWNQLANVMNEALAAPVARETGEDGWFCPQTDGDSDKLSWSGGANLVVTLEDGTKKTLLDNYQGQTCTQIADHAIAQQLYDEMNGFVIFSDKTDCPNGYGH